MYGDSNMTAKAGKTLFIASEVAELTGVPALVQGQRYAHRMYQPSKDDVIPRGHGDARSVTTETVYQIAIAEACSRANLPIRRAVNAARLFAEDQSGRRANTLYEYGRTLLKISETGAEIINAPFDATLTDICGRPFQAAFIIDIGPIVGAVNEKLVSIKRKSK